MWVRAYDSAKKVYYYYNSITGAVSYKKPTEVRVYNSPKLDLASTEKRIKVAEHEIAPSSNIVRLLSTWKKFQVWILRHPN